MLVACTPEFIQTVVALFFLDLLALVKIIAQGKANVSVAEILVKITNVPFSNISCYDEPLAFKDIIHAQADI